MISQNELEQLLADIESDRTERTDSISKAPKFAEAICAFANDMPGHGQAGYLFIGVAKDGRPSGVEITDQLLQNLAAIRSDGQILPPPVMNVDKRSVGGVDIAVVEVFPSDRPPVSYQGRIHIRVGPRRAVATQEETRRLSERRIDHEKTWDLRPCVGASVDDLALSLFTLDYLPRAVARDVLAENGRKLEEQLAALRFFDLRRQLPTNGGILLFGKDPLSFFPGDYVQFVRYAGRSAADDVLTERRFSGDLRQIMEGLDLLARELGNPRPVRQPDLRDATVYDYPPLALHELFMNGVIHRNYDGSSSPVSIDCFDDRIEISNPGSLYGDLSRHDFPRGTSYRNPVVAEAAKTLGFVNRFGRGIAVAQQAMVENASPPVQLQPGENFFLAIVGRRL